MMMAKIQTFSRTRLRPKLKLNSQLKTLNTCVSYYTT